jgi:anti-anti-sigma factor
VGEVTPVDAMITKHGNIVEIRLQGEFRDGSVWKEHSDEIAAALSGRAAPMIAVNMARVQTISSIALGSLIFLTNRIIPLGGSVALIAVPPKIMRVLRTAHLDAVFRIWKSLDELKEDIRNTPPEPLL